jgi:hypothetical protein
MDKINVLGGYIGLDGYAYPADNCIKSRGDLWGNRLKASILDYHLGVSPYGVKALLPAVCATSEAGLFCDFCHRSIVPTVDYVTVRSKAGGIILLVPSAEDAAIGFAADWLACGECHKLIQAERFGDLLCGALLAEDNPFDFTADIRGLKGYLEFLCGVWSQVFAVDLSSEAAEIFYNFQIGVASKTARC